MLVSMTGFGKAAGSFGNKKIAVEIKSLNSKQFDLSVKVPSVYREKEMDIRQTLAASLDRGKIDIAIFFESGETEKRISLNRPLAIAYWEEIKHLSQDLNIQPGPEIIPTLLTMPEVLQTDRNILIDGEWNLVKQLIQEAVTDLLHFRKVEGTRLAEDITSRIHAIENRRLKVESLLEERLNIVRERIARNVKDLLTDDQFDRNRLEQEIIYYIEKLDITEETIRLKQHCEFFLDTMGRDDLPGKKLGFIAQEIGREINTMGSKANFVPIQKLVVEMKDELEKIKEQLLNIG